MKKVTLELTENEIKALLIALSTSHKEYFQFPSKERIYFNELGEKIAEKAIQQLNEDE